MKRIILSVTALFVFSIVLSSCSSVTTIDGTWKSPSATATKYKKIAVIGLSPDLVKRSTVERSVVNNLISNGFSAVSGSTILPQSLYDSDSDGKFDNGAKEKIIETLKSNGVDGVITIAVEDVKKSVSYVPGTSYYAPSAGMYGFGGYYGGAYNGFYGGGIVNNPGYYQQNTQYVVTTNFYNVGSEKLMWSTQSGTMDPSSLNDFATSYGSSVVSAFVESGVARK